MTAYSETRMEDLKELCNGLSFRNPEIIDVMRFFKADRPACQFEAGQQKGGHYFCWECDIHCSNVKDYVYSSYRKIYSYQDRQEKIIKSSGCIVLHCIALHCIALHCIALHCIALHCTVLYCIVLYFLILIRFLKLQLIVSQTPIANYLYRIIHK